LSPDTINYLVPINGIIIGTVLSSIASTYMYFHKKKANLLLSTYSKAFKLLSKTKSTEISLKTDLDKYEFNKQLDVLYNTLRTENFESNTTAHKLYITIGLLYLNLFNTTKEKSNLVTAIKIFTMVLDKFDFKLEPLEYLDLLMVIGELQLKLSEFENKNENLEKALNIFKQALKNVSSNPYLFESQEALKYIYKDSILHPDHLLLNSDKPKPLKLSEIILDYIKNIEFKTSQTTVESKDQFCCEKKPEKIIGDYEKALSFREREFDIGEKVLDPQYPDVANSLNNLAVYYHQIGDYKKALSYYQRALEIYEKVLGPQNPDVANSLNNLGELYRQIGDYKKALPLYQKALNIREKVLGLQHPDVANSLNSLAGLHNNMGDYDKALPLCQSALEIYEKVLGPQHPDIAATLNNLASLYDNMGNYEKALPLYQKALDIREKTLGPQNSDVANSLNNLAVHYHQIGDYEKALSYYQRALEVYEKVLGPQNPDVANSLNNLAGLYNNTGDYKKALPLFSPDIGITVEITYVCIFLLPSPDTRVTAEIA
jgi:tetratricopeptide (TPR) repeat protein